MLSAMPRRYELLSILVAVTMLGACERRKLCQAADCGTLVEAAIGEPGTLLPTSAEETTAQDIDEQLFLKLADVGPSMNTVGDEDFQPLLAEKWEWDGPLTLVFHIDPRARWHDGQKVSALDVAFTFDAYTDSEVASPFRAQLKRIASVTARDSL
ncbi:MAG: ABC transporter substrate-binding protein, partial [Myxococcales bacterium]